MPLAAHVRDNSDARDFHELPRSHREEFLADVASKRRPATVCVRSACSRRFSTAGSPPTVPDEPVEVLPLDVVRRLLASSDGRGFADRRDTAILVLLLDICMRAHGHCHAAATARSALTPRH